MTTGINRSYYSGSIADFLEESEFSILGKLGQASGFSDDRSQKYAWLTEIEILKRALAQMEEGYILLEYNIPRMGRRIDAVVLLRQSVCVIEFKVGARSFADDAIEQVMDYALDLKYFHSASHTVPIIPILVATESQRRDISDINYYNDLVAEPILVTPEALRLLLGSLSKTAGRTEIVFSEWIQAPYKPTPTIIEAAQVLFRGHSVADLSRNDAGAINLERTSAAIDRIIDDTKANGGKSICFVTGVPGAGKTLAGLVIATSRQKFEEEEHAVYLSGNGPLVQVLREALARDESHRFGIRKSQSMIKARAMIQPIHHFRDDALQTIEAPHEKVTIFDEAQRAWDADQLGRFMRTRKGLSGFDQSEPEFLIDVMDRHQDWAVIVCLVGEGQEIHTGEAGIGEWFRALIADYPDWNVFVSPQIMNKNYARGADVSELVNHFRPDHMNFVDDLHLAVSIRSFRSERLSDFVGALLANDSQSAARLLAEVITHYPIAVTRDLDLAREWVRDQARGTERYGLVASSGAKRLRPHGIWVDYKIEAPNWFLNPNGDIRSSFGLEVVATEFDIQGLELDWAIVGWDGDLRHNGDEFQYLTFSGASWKTVWDDSRIRYLINTYRVLLTRARQGMVIFVPEGDIEDHTRSPEYYDHTYRYLRSLGIPSLE